MPQPLNISNIYIYIKVCSLGFIKLAPIKKVSKESKNSEERQREREREKGRVKGEKNMRKGEIEDILHRE